jgi:hypothetical protein
MTNVRVRRWRLGVGVSLVLGSVSLVSGLAFALFSSAGTGDGTAIVGTLNLGLDTPASSSCDFSSLSPGDLTGSPACDLSVHYSGTVPAYVSLSVEINAKPGSGGTPLYDGTNTSGLSLVISDGHHDFVVPTGPGATGGSCPTGETCWSSPNDLAAWYQGGSPRLVFLGSSPNVTWTVTPTFSRTSGNAFEGASAQLTLRVQAVQSWPVGLPLGCSASTIGQSCPANGSFGWG